MTGTIPSMRQQTRTVMACLAVGLVAALTGCDHPTMASVSGINYTDENIAGFQVIQPDNFDNRSPTQEAMAYGASGRMCCYSLPYTWHEGLKVRLKVEPDIMPVEGQDYLTEYARRRDTDTLYRNVEVPVSAYAPGKAQLLWVQFLPNQQYRAIATDLDPKNPDFPSDQKGWPVPSVAFRHKLWETEIKETRDTIAVAERDISKEYSEREWRELWENYAKYKNIREKEKNNFKGYDDLCFREYEKNLEKEIYEYALKRMDRLKEIEPK